MDGAELVEAIRDERATELDRLGSEKALVAETNADLEARTVLEATVATCRRTRDLFGAWSDDEPDDRAATAFTDAQSAMAATCDRITVRMDGEPELGPETGATAVFEHLREVDGTAARVGAGLVGLPLVRSRTLLQVVNFFVNEADTANADLFREVRADTEALIEDGAGLLEEVCTDEADWRRAREAAGEVIGVAYDEYAETLRGMGLDPKPVC